MKYLIEDKRKLQEAIDESYKKGRIKFDFNGHYRAHKSDEITKKIRDLEIIGLMISCVLKDDEFDNLLEATKSGKATKMTRLGLTGLGNCFDCGKRTRWEFDGVTLRIVEECKYKDGVPSFVFELNVPSGTMVVANDLRDGFKIIGDYNVNELEGMQKTTMKYAEVGMAHCFVGNTCPGMFKVGKEKTGSTFRIGRGRGKGVAGICTDLWWYSIVDLDAWVKAYERQPTKQDLNNMCLVKCRPGVYKFTHQYHCIDPDTSGATYSTVEWVREPDPVVDYRSKYLAIDFTAGQIVRGVMKNQNEDTGYLRRYEENIGPSPKQLKFFRAVSKIFCVNGSGMELHPNGWIGNDLICPPMHHRLKFRSSKGDTCGIGYRNIHFWHTVPVSAQHTNISTAKTDASMIPFLIWRSTYARISSNMERIFTTSNSLRRLKKNKKKRSSIWSRSVV